MISDNEGDGGLGLRLGLRPEIVQRTPSSSSSSELVTLPTMSDEELMVQQKRGVGRGWDSSAKLPELNP